MECELCSGRTKNSCYFLDTNYRIDFEGDLHIEVDNEYVQLQFYIEIKYCPECGKKVEKWVERFRML